MNDTELDRLLDAWDVPVPSPALRAGLRDRFPRAPRRWFSPRWRWVLVAVVASGTLAIGMQQAGDNNAGSWLMGVISSLYNAVMFNIEARDAGRIVVRIRNAQPDVYVDGQLQSPLEFGHASTLIVRIPGKGEYSVLLFRLGIKGVVEAGRIHNNVVEFEVAGSHVRIVCNKPVVDSDHPVFLMHH